MKAAKAAKMATDNVNAAELGRILGISRASIANLATDGILPRASRGEFNLPAAVQAYLRHKLVKAGDADVAGKSLVSERSRLARLKADACEREAKLESGELVPSADIDAAWLAVAGVIRSRILLVPTRAAPRVVGMTVAAEIKALLQKELHAALANIAQTPTVRPS